MFTKIAVLLTLTAITITYALGAPSPRVVQACTGGWGSLNELAQYADAVAVVDILSAGGAENMTPPLVSPTAQATATSSVPTVVASPTATWTPAPFGNDLATPTPVPTMTATPTPPAIVTASNQLPFDLTGYGARVSVVQSIYGNLPSQFDLDAAVRRGLEEQIRRLEATPNMIVPCALGTFSTRYEAGQRAVVFLSQQDGNWSTMTRYLVSSSSNALLPEPAAPTTAPVLAISTALRQGVFAQYPAEALPYYGNDGQQLQAPRFWLLQATGLPTSVLAQAVAAIKSGAVPDPHEGDIHVPAAPDQPVVSPTAVTSRPQNPGTIRPPDTGSAGLR